MYSNKINICKISLTLFLTNLFFLTTLIAQKKVALKGKSYSVTETHSTNTSNSCSPSSEAYQKKYSQQSFYIPTRHDHAITLKITAHIFIPGADTGRWQMNDNEFNGVRGFKSMLDSITNGHFERYSAERRATYNIENFNSPYIHDSKIIYELTNIYFYSNLALCFTNNDQELFQYIEKTDSNRLGEGLPIVFVSNNNAGHLSSYNGLAAIVTTIQAVDPVFDRCHLLHEIAHAFGLGHTYKNNIGGGSEWQNFNAACGSSDYLSDVFPNNNPLCANEGRPTFKPDNPPCLSCYEASPDTSNNVMGGQRYNLWMSPLQMGRRIRSMHLNANNGHNIRQYAKDMESNHRHAWIISSDEIWDFDIQMYNDIVVKKGVTLTIKCKTAMAIDGKIKLEDGAKLIVDGGEITGWCKTGSWHGIQLPKTKKKDNKSVNPAAIELINNGRITKAKIQVSTN